MITNSWSAMWNLLFSLVFCLTNQQYRGLHCHVLISLTSHSLSLSFLSHLDDNSHLWTAISPLICPPHAGRFHVLKCKHKLALLLLEICQHFRNSFKVFSMIPWYLHCVVNSNHSVSSFISLLAITNIVFTTHWTICPLNMLGKWNCTKETKQKQTTTNNKKCAARCHEIHECKNWRKASSNDLSYL